MSESVGEVENPSLGDVGAISRSLGSEGSSSVRSGKSMKHVKQKKEKPVQGVKVGVVFLCFFLLLLLPLEVEENGEGIGFVLFLCVGGLGRCWKDVDLGFCGGVDEWG